MAGKEGSSHKYTIEEQLEFMYERGHSDAEAYARGAGILPTYWREKGTLIFTEEHKEKAREEMVFALNIRNRLREERIAAEQDSLPQKRFEQEIAKRKLLQTPPYK